MTIGTGIAIFGIWLGVALVIFGFSRMATAKSPDVAGVSFAGFLFALVATIVLVFY